MKTVKTVKLVSAFLLTAWISFAQASVILQIDANGNLTGAKDVLVNGALYDVQFLDGTCIALFNGCDAPSDFTFTDHIQATYAATALLDLVFIDFSPTALFDSEPQKTIGCSDTDICYVITPFALTEPTRAYELDASSANNSSPSNGNPDRVGFSGPNRASDFSLPIFHKHTYALWIPVISAPEPGTIMLLSLGIAGLSLSRYRKKS